jgi:RNA polymerase sigma factor (sigma-70 family)
MIRLDAELVHAARSGNRIALAELVRTVERPVFNLAMRMLAHRADAEDATQEILILVVTHLSDVRDGGAAGAWAFRLACRHLVYVRKRSRVEAVRFTFRGFDADLEDGLADAAGAWTSDPAFEAAIREVKIGCTTALLTCLSRPLRAAYILGDIFELTDRESAAALEIEPGAFRQRLRRARTLVTAFLQAKCGVMSAAAKCRCAKRVNKAVEIGRVTLGAPDRDTLASPAIASIEAQIARLERDRAAAALMRSNPNFTAEVAALALAALDGR